MLRLFNTLSRKVEELYASDRERLRFYCCGPTVYGPAHIGNFRTFLVQDLFRRTVELGGLATCHVRNLTDVDDKTIRQSRIEGKTLKDFTSFWTKKFHEDGKALNMLSPHFEPGAVDHVPEQIAMIEGLVEKRLAYRTEDGSVYFSVGAFDGYGKLSGLDKRELKEGAGGRQESDDYEKDTASDFALWKARKEEDGDNFWSSPWGEGRPGWHLECSAMSLKYLGDSFDLHSGGVDLCFPHHENEIAQSEGCTGHDFCRHWFHIAHLMVDGKKMSKSLGNLYTLGDMQEKGYSPPALRMALLSGHYRQSLNFSLRNLNAAAQGLEKLSRVYEKLDNPLSYEEVCHKSGESGGIFQKAWEMLNEDLNAPASLGQVFGALKEKKPEEIAKDAGDRLGFMRMWHAFGWAASKNKETACDIPADIREKAEKRWEAKKNKDFAMADGLREELATKGWLVKDAKDNYTLFPQAGA